jgi:uncharacterized protein (DUF1330 family)
MTELRTSTENASANVPGREVVGRWVEIEFECLPMRTISRLDIPVDASPKYEQFILRVKAALEKHGSHNSFYLHRGSCTFHLTNEVNNGNIEMAFEGTVLTDINDQNTKSVDLSISLARETCSWLNERIVEFFTETTKRAVLAEFNRYIAAGDLEKTRQRIESLGKQDEQNQGYIGMYL